MTNVGSKALDMVRLISRGGPALCNIAVTNSCNAFCDFCNFANGKVNRKDIRWINAEQFDAALQILYHRGIRYVSFFGGEPLLHPRLAEMIAMSIAKGMGPALITNGWLLSSKLDELAAAGLKTIYVSIDAPLMADHEHNRGLQGLGQRIRGATSRMPSLALAWSSVSELMKFTDAELIRAFEAVDDLRQAFQVNNPSASIADMKRHLLGQPEQFVCYGGYKSFYMDWNFDMWRCDAWQERMCSVWDFANTPLVRDGCTACIADCYRDSSVMLHFAVSLGDAIECLSKGHVIAALKAMMDVRNLKSLGAVAGNAPILSRLAKVG